MSKEYNEQLRGKSTEEILDWLFSNFSITDITFSSSLGAEDQVLTDLLIKRNEAVNIFTLDTGRLFESTYKVIQDVKEFYGKNIEIKFPEAEDIETLVKTKGPNLFYNSIDDRKKCCRVRKIKPLKKKLEGYKIWITGLRREQSVTRTDQEVIEWDETFSIYKLSPLLDWSEDDVWKYIKEKNVPYNNLHDKGFPSIGCEPCTRAVSKGEDLRSGRWWWEEPEHKECGLHFKDGKLVRGGKSGSFR